MKTKDTIDLVAEFLYNNSQHIPNEEQETSRKEFEKEVEEPEFLKQTMVLPCGTFYL